MLLAFHFKNEIIICLNRHTPQIFNDLNIHNHFILKLYIFQSALIQNNTQ